MALDPRISLAVQAPSIDIGQAFRAPIQGAGMLQQLQQQRELQPLRKQLLEQQAQAGQVAAEQEQLKMSDQERNRQILSVATGAQGLLAELGSDINIGAGLKYLNRRLEDLSASETPDTRKLQDTKEAIAILESGDAKQIQWLMSKANDVIEIARSQRLLEGADGVDERFSPTTINLEDGTSIQTTSTGRKIVKDVAGNELKGEEAKAAIKESVRFGAEGQRLRSGARVRATELEKQRQDFVKQALSARSLMKDTSKLLELNELITTGKTAQARKFFGDLFGVTDPNLGEFNSKAGQIVLGQIRQLGANPTEGERAFLTQITPSLEQGGAVNEALLRDMLEIQQRQVNRGKWLTKNPEKTVEDYLLETDEDDFTPSSLGGSTVSADPSGADPSGADPSGVQFLGFE